MAEAWEFSLLYGCTESWPLDRLKFCERMQITSLLQCERTWKGPPSIIKLFNMLEAVLYIAWFPHSLYDIIFLPVDFFFLEVPCVCCEISNHVVFAALGEKPARTKHRHGGIA